MSGVQAEHIEISMEDIKLEDSVQEQETFAQEEANSIHSPSLTGSILTQEGSAPLDDHSLVR